MHLVGFTMEIYYDARSYKRRISLEYSVKSTPTTMLRHSAMCRDSKAAWQGSIPLARSITRFSESVTHIETQVQFTESGIKKKPILFMSLGRLHSERLRTVFFWDT